VPIRADRRSVIKPEDQLKVSMFENHKPIKRLGPHCPQCGKRPSPVTLLHDYADQFVCKNCKLPMRSISGMSRFAFFLLMLVTIPILMIAVIPASIFLVRLLFENSGQGAEILVLLCGIGLLLSFVGWPLTVIYWTKHIEPWVPTCHKCGYNLTVMTDNCCPECGTTYDPYYIPILKRDITQIRFNRKVMIRMATISCMLFVGLTTGSLIYSMVYESAVIRIGWPTPFASYGVHQGVVVKMWSSGGFIADLGSCAIFSWVIECFRQNICRKLGQQVKQIDQSTSE